MLGLRDETMTMQEPQERVRDAMWNHPGNSLASMRVASQSAQAKETEGRIKGGYLFRKVRTLPFVEQCLHFIIHRHEVRDVETTSVIWRRLQLTLPIHEGIHRINL